MTEIPEATVKAVRYRVNSVPEDPHGPADLFALAVEYRGSNRWAVVLRGSYLGTDGAWSYGHDWPGEPTPDQYEAYEASRQQWLDTHRFDEDTALRLAQEAAPHITVNGYTVTDALAMQQKRAERHG